MAGEAIRQTSGVKDYTIKGLVLHAALVLVESRSVELITNLKPSQRSGWYDFTITSHNKTNWVRHCNGSIKAGVESQASTPLPETMPRNMYNPYGAMRKVGLNYGLTFKGLKNVSALPGDFTATAQAVRTTTSTTDYAIHPTTIDHCLQLIILADSEGLDRKLNRLAVPTSVGLLCVTADLAQDVMFARASCESHGLEKSVGSVTLTSCDRNILYLEDGGLTFMESEVIPDRYKAGAAELTWAPHIDFVPLDTLIRPIRKDPGLFDDVHILTLLASLEIRSRSASITFGADYLARFDSVLQEFIRQATSLELKHFARIDTQRLTNLGTEERQHMISTMTEQIRKTNFAPIGELISRVVDNTMPILAGTTSTIEVLIRDNALTEVYNVIGGMADCGGFFSAVAHSKPTIRILEIGAGTGGTTAIALHNLLSSHQEPLYSVYTFTDISPGFFPTAAERFKEYQNLEYKILDITKDPIEQGFLEGSYDLIIAANVLHATPELVTTLSNVRQLLHPRGRLFLQELNTGAVHYVDLIMGGLRDWWLGSDDGRPDRPYVTAERWDKDLRQAGFAGIEGVVYDDAEPNVLQNIVARPQQDLDEYQRVTLLVAPEQTIAASVVEDNLVTRGFTVNKCTLYDDFPPYQNIISLIDLQKPLLESISADDFEQLMKVLSKLDSAGILWVTTGTQIQCSTPGAALILGLARTARSEMSIPFVTLELDVINDSSCSEIINVFRRFQDRTDSSALDLEREYALVNGVLHVSRYHALALSEEVVSSKLHAPIYLGVGRSAQINSLQWQQGAEVDVGPEEVVVTLDKVANNTAVS
jgi:SAM-dependent methyltransferase